MASLIRMPGISADAEEAALVEWFVEEGEEIAAGSPLAAVETEKATVDIDADEGGVVFKLLAEPGMPVAIGAPIAVIVAPDEDTANPQEILDAVGLGNGGAPTEANEVAKDPQESDEMVQDAVSAQPSSLQASGPAPSSAQTTPDTSEPGVQEPRLFASPIVRRLAREQGIDLSGVSGTGPGGRIVRDDLANAQRPPEITSIPASIPSGERTEQEAPALVPHSKMRVAVANALAGSKRVAPHFYMTVRCDVGDLLALREQINQVSATRISVNDFVIKAAAQGFVEVPDMNVQWHDDGLLFLPSVDISVAIASEKGLVTPVIRHANRARLAEVSHGVKAFVESANGGRLKQTDLEGGSLTVTNLGMYGVEHFSAIINPPQVGILAVGVVTEEVRVDDAGNVSKGHLMALTLSADHRPVDGALAARWLQSVKRNLEAPLSMLV